MADNLELLWTLKADSSQAQATLKSTQAAVAGLRSSFGSDLAIMEKVGTQALKNVSTEAANLVRNVPLIGNSFSAALGPILSFGQAVKSVSASTATLTELTGAAAVATKTLAEAQEAAAAADAAVLAAKEAYVALSGPMTAGTYAEATAMGALTAAEEAAAIAEAELVAAKEVDIIASEGLAAANIAVEASLAPLIVTIGAVAILIGGAAVIVGGLGLAIFELTKKNAAFVAGLNDIAQKTGISIQAISTLNVAAETSGVSIESANKSLGRYFKSISDVEHGNKELAASFKQAGFTADELTAAHASNDKAIQLLVTHVGGLNNSQDRLNELTKLGVKNGQDLNAVITEMDGDFVKFQQHVAELGLVITPEQAAAADRFDDTLKILDLQIKGIALTITQEVLPAFQSALDDISSALTGQKGDWKSWGLYIRDQINFVHAELVGLFAFVNSLKTTGGGWNWAGNIATAVSKGADAEEQANLAAAARNAQVPTTGRTTGTETLGSKVGGKGTADTAAKKAAVEEYRVALKAAADDEKDAQIAFQTNTRHNKEELDQQTIDLAKYTEDAKRYNEQLRAAATARFDAETKAANIAEEKKVLSQVKYNEKQKEILTARKEADEKFNAADAALDDALQKGKAASVQATNARIYADQVASDNRLLAEDQRLADEGLITYETAENRRQEIEQAAFERTRQHLKDEISSVATDAEKRKALTHELLDLYNDYHQKQRDNINKTREAKDQDLQKDKRDEAEHKAIQEKWIADDIAALKKRAAATAAGGFSQGLSSGQFGKLTDELTGAEKGITSLGDAFQIMGQVAGAAVQGLAQGIGSLVQNMVLMGTAGPHAMQKLVASVLAGVAAQAATQAVLFTAYGLAALTPWGAVIYGPATQWFEAAALMAGIAVTSGLAGRAVAGGAFKDTAGANPAGGGASPGGSGGGSSSSGPSSQGTNTIIQNRNTDTTHTITLRVESNDSHIVKVINNDVKNNGSTRNLIVETAAKG